VTSVTCGETRSPARPYGGWARGASAWGLRLSSKPGSVRRPRCPCSP
jgi:hypothetical protein